jgi:hypothetical protein
MAINAFTTAARIDDYNKKVAEAAKTFERAKTGDIVYVDAPAAHEPGGKATNPKDAIGDNKLPAHLVSPIIKAYQAIAHFLGNIKYGAWNYRAGGARASIYYGACNRHLDAWWEGQRCDPVDGTPHLANALACIGILIECEEGGNLTDDRPPSRIAAYERLRKEFEGTMVKVREQYKHKAPRHWTIADTKLSAFEARAELHAEAEHAKGN